MKDFTQPNDEEPVLIDDPAALKPKNPKDSYKGRKYEPDIDGPEQNHRKRTRYILTLVKKRTYQQAAKMSRI